jgi:hypothetical protein
MVIFNIVLGALARLNSNFLVIAPTLQIAFRYAHYFRAQVDRTEITFHNQNYTYVFFSYYENDINPPIKEAGVRVTQHNSDGTKGESKCRGNPVSHLGVLESVIPRDNDSPLNQ